MKTMGTYVDADENDGFISQGDVTDDVYDEIGGSFLSAFEGFFGSAAFIVSTYLGIDSNPLWYLGSAAGAGMIYDAYKRLQKLG